MSVLDPPTIRAMSDVLPAGLASLGAVVGFIVGSIIGRVIVAVVYPFGPDLADLLGVTIGGLAGAFGCAWLGLRLSRRWSSGPPEVDPPA